MNRLVQSLAVGAMLMFGMAAVVSAADATDPIIGTWKLNLDRSKYAAGAAPKSLARTYVATPGGTQTTVTGVAADGSAISQSATLTDDGTDNAWTGSTTYDTVWLKRVNGTTVKADLKKGGKIIGHTTRTLTGKGTVMTLSTAVKTAKGGTATKSRSTTNSSGFRGAPLGVRLQAATDPAFMKVEAGRRHCVRRIGGSET